MTKINFRKFILINVFSIFRQKLRLFIFRSPIEEIVSLKSFIKYVKAKLIYRFHIRKFVLKKSKNSKKFINYGYVTFTNKNIHKECIKIFKKLNDKNVAWLDNVNDKISLSYNGDPSVFLKGELVNIFKSGVDKFLKEIFESDYKIIYHVLIKSNNNNSKTKPSGSMLWHSDGRRGTRINLHICHSYVSNENGAMKCLSWKDSLKVHFYTISEFTKSFALTNSSKNKISKKDLREMKVNLMAKYIKDNSINYFQPKTNKSGLIYAFRNNNIHCGGFPKVGNERIISILNIEPSSEQTTVEEKFSQTHLKTNFNQ